MSKNSIGLFVATTAIIVFAVILGLVRQTSFFEKNFWGPKEGSPQTVKESAIPQVVPSSDPEVNPWKPRPDEARCGTLQEGDYACMSQALLSCSPAMMSVLTDNGELGILRITGEKNGNCIVYNSRGRLKDDAGKGEILCAVPQAFISILSETPLGKSGELSTGNPLFDGLVYATFAEATTESDAFSIADPRTGEDVRVFCRRTQI